MFHAVMRYQFRPEHQREAIALWENAVKGKIEVQPGFSRVQLYAHPDGEVMAIGSWRAKEDAEMFMKTGVFKRILEDLEPYLLEQPQNRVYDLQWFAEGENKNA